VVRDCRIQVRSLHMNKSTKATSLVVVAVVFVLIAVGYALFHGYFDHGRFEIKQVQRASGKQVAIVAGRSDQEAMSAYTYFVLIGDHVFSPAELRRAYYSNGVVFAAGNSCVGVHWEGPDKLVVACNGSTLERSAIDVQKQRSGGIAISYENIPIK
jgi:hypothetical protein